MRKVSLLSVLFLLYSISLLAQGKSRTGFKAGVNYFAQRIEETSEYRFSDFRTGLTVGLFREIPLGKLFVFQPEILYNRMGGELDGTVTKLDYISVPLTLKLQGKRFGAYLGPQLSLLINGKSKPELGDEVEVKDMYKSADIGGVTGFEYSLGPNNRFVINARYQFSINDVWKDAEAGESLRNTGVSLTVGFRF